MLKSRESERVGIKLGKLRKRGVSYLPLPRIFLVRPESRTFRTLGKNFEGMEKAQPPVRDFSSFRFSQAARLMKVLLGSEQRRG